ncbi:MAG: type II toxin-antitoxin system VapC family toxin [Chloroflexi bacterium]|nr:type II toxin-antitoxin system VapC family toxin [Chloroflexota bacterium]MCH8225550.1 type II toxin-antitoxin system VapC family toxin [Chloroflexota bacterium]MCI0846523.1 type II toxin-antitoxin system VapC family toxin [Chloroflexota bacterium]
MPGNVVDASVIAAIAFQEPRTLEAEAILEGADLVAPPLLGFELANIARNKAIRDPHLRRVIEEGLLEVLQFDIQWQEVDHIAVLALALETGLTTYDASYLYLARTLGIPLVTFDQRLQAAVSGPG